MQVLSASGDKPGSVLVLQKKDATGSDPTQLFRGEGKFIHCKVRDQLVVDIFDWAEEENSKVGLWSKNDGVNQQFRLEQALSEECPPGTQC